MIYTDSLADHVIKFCETLKFSAGSYVGKPVKLEEFQKDMIRRWFATDINGKRIARVGLLSIARKCGKSEIVAMVMLCMMWSPRLRQENSQLIIASLTREQSQNIFRILSYFITADKFLMKDFRIIPSGKRIVHLATQSELRVVPLDSGKLMGANIFAAALDEVGSWNNIKGEEFYQSVITSTSVQENSLILLLSTQPASDTHFYASLIDYAKKVNLGDIIDPGFAGVIYDTPLEADIYSPETWMIANPALGIFKSMEYMHTQAERARKMPTAEASFRNLDLNQRIDSHQPFISRSTWLANSNHGPHPDLTGRECWAGLDLSTTTDITSLALVFPEEVKGVMKLRALSFSWKAEDTLEDHSNRDRAPYTTWKRQGWLKTTPGKVINYNYIAQELQILSEKYNIQLLFFDRWKMDALKMALEAIDCGLPLKEFGQGFVSFAPAITKFETLLLEEKLLHDDNPLLTWTISNTVIEQDPSGNRKVTKTKSRSRIDPVVALIEAVAAWTLAGEHKEKEMSSIYDDDTFYASIGGVLES